MPAQTWSPPFNHNEPHAGNGVFTSPYSPWSGLPGSSAPSPTATFTAPATVAPQVAYSGGGVFWKGWPQPDPAINGRSFNAVHMAVIPKGPYRGHVLVWNNVEVSAAVNPPGVPPLSTMPSPYVVLQSYQAYAIIDPADLPLEGIRYRNFLVPTGDPLTIEETMPVIAENMFCAGHAWSAHGDLIVPGATDFELVVPPLPDLPYVNYAGGSLVYVFNPRATCQWPGTSIEYYPSTVGAGSPCAADYHGMWVRADDLLVPRWYPTATLTHRLVRQAIHPQTGPIAGTANQERMVFLGGSATVPALPNDPANFSYEAYVILGECDNVQPNRSKLVPDYASGPVPFLPAEQDRTWSGPGVVGGTLQQDWLYEYPRTFLLTTGELFFSGYAPRSAWIDHDLAPGVWQQADAQPGAPLTYSSNWQDIRHDGSAVLFPGIGGSHDVVLRLGGAHDQGDPTTDTVETIAAGNLNATWVPAASMPAASLPGTPLPDGGRIFTNLVILPNADLLLLGGQWQDGLGAAESTPVPLLFHGGQWSKLQPNTVRSRRTYHSTAVLLPDGRIFLGGGDDRDWDYEIFSPPYLNAPLVRPMNVVWTGIPPVEDPNLGADILTYDAPYKIACDPLPHGHAVVRAALTAPCSVTHHTDMHQRYVELKTQVEDGCQVTFTAPSDERLAPRGIYMLWLITNTGTPSVARWVVLR